MVDRGRDGGTFQAEMDGLSLHQALLDFEVANARVLDLTRRLMEAQAEIVELRAQVDTLRLQYGELQQVHDAMKSSNAFRTASRIWALRNAIGR